MGTSPRFDEKSDVDADATAGFADFYDRELQPQFRRARLILGSTEAAEDVVHHAFVEVWRRWDAITEAGPYLNRAVINGARATARRDRRRLEILRSRWGSTNDTDRPANEVLSDVLARLPFNQRSAIVLRYYAGLTDTQIAATMGCPIGSVGPWIHRALGTMRKALT